MTTLYRPVDVLTKTQAAAGGVIHLDDGEQHMWLVPIEAEEEWRASWPEDDAHQRCRDERTARLWEQQQDATAMSRLVTPWEEQS